MVILNQFCSGKWAVAAIKMNMNDSFPSEADSIHGIRMLGDKQRPAAKSSLFASCDAKLLSSICVPLVHTPKNFAVAFLLQFCR